MRGKQHNARWTFWFSPGKDPSLSGKIRNGQKKGAIQHPPGFQRTLGEVLLKDHKTKLVKLMVSVL